MKEEQTVKKGFMDSNQLTNNGENPYCDENSAPTTLKIRREFSIIETYFSDLSYHPLPDILLGVGDDCALVAGTSSPQKAQAFSVDTLVSGVHFLPNTPGEHVGYKALAVNLSDLAAMGATPSWFTLALTMPDIREDWLLGFSKGLKQLAQEHQLSLIGGDTTQGPLSITIQIAGHVSPQLALRRDRAVVGDRVFVSGSLGGAALALEALQQKVMLTEDDASLCLPRLLFPTPRVTLGQQLLGVAHACIDLSDGLQGDLQHILTKSQVGAVIHLEALPLFPLLTKYKNRTQAIQSALTFGDDYELCFTAPVQQRAQIAKISQMLDLPIYEIGTITEEKSLKYIEGNTLFDIHCLGSAYEHF